MNKKTWNLSKLHLKLAYFFLNPEYPLLFLLASFSAYLKLPRCICSLCPKKQSTLLGYLIPGLSDRS